MQSSAERPICEPMSSHEASTPPPASTASSSISVSCPVHRPPPTLPEPLLAHVRRAAVLLPRPAPDPGTREEPSRATPSEAADEAGGAPCAL